MFRRLEILIGDNIQKLKNANVILFGVGGVGGYVAEMLIRSGLGKLTIVDFDVVDVDGAFDLPGHVREEVKGPFHDGDHDGDLFFVHEPRGQLTAEASVDGLDLLTAQNDFVSHGGFSYLFP